MNIQAMMKQAQKLQKDMMETQEKINETEFTGKSSIVTVKMNGKKELLDIKIEIEKIEEDDVYFTTFSSSPKVDLELREDDYSVFKMVDPIEMAMKKFAIQTKIFGEPITETSLFQLQW